MTDVDEQRALAVKRLRQAQYDVECAIGYLNNLTPKPEALIARVTFVRGALMGLALAAAEGEPGKTAGQRPDVPCPVCRLALIFQGGIGRCPRGHDL